MFFLRLIIKFITLIEVIRKNIINLLKAKNMLDLCKEVLQKVSFDRYLFKKELFKAIKWVAKDELLILKAWCFATFGHQYDDVLAEAFS